MLDILADLSGYREVVLTVSCIQVWGAKPPAKLKTVIINSPAAMFENTPCTIVPFLRVA